MMKKIIQTFRTSVTIKSLAFLILLTTGILVCMEVVTSINIRHFEQRTLDNYRDSMKNYCAYWDDKLNSINSSMLQLTSINDTTLAYWNVCNAEKKLDIEISKMQIMQSVSEIAGNHQNEIVIFCYVPERNIYLKSTNRLFPIEERSRLDKNIREYVEKTELYNSTKWNYFMSSDRPYFFNIFHSDGGYIGAFVPCETILEGLIQENGVVSEVVLTDRFGEQIQVMGADDDSVKEVYSFDIDMEYLDYSMRINLLRQYVFTDREYMIVLSLATVVVGIVLLIGNLFFQMRFVLGPLNILKRAMERFSQGRFDTRLKVTDKNNEINILFCTFNEMIEQISNLKIKVYESKLEQERIQSNYMRVQIQPHFYTNILNLIYGLAQIGDYRSIQKLAMTTGSYFRYLLGEKGTFVLLKEELNCVNSYIEIQKMRYGDALEFSMQVEPGAEEQLVLPMVLQTFVGNCIKHNITLVPVLHVQIRIRKTESMLWFEIEDNGVGFASGVLKQLNDGKNISKDGKHIGISNVKERMKLFYGEKSRVVIESEKRKTVVTVTFPELITEEEKHEYHTGR